MTTHAFSRCATNAMICSVLRFVPLEFDVAGEGPAVADPFTRLSVLGEDAGLTPPSPMGIDLSSRRGRVSASVHVSPCVPMHAACPDAHAMLLQGQGFMT